MKKSQTVPAVILLMLMVAGGKKLGAVNPFLGLAWTIGIILGIIMQKSRFCFTASLRDPLLTGSTALTRATIIAFAVATVGFAAIQYTSWAKGLGIPGNISPVGIHTVVGALLFGIGMVIAGGCASGTLMRAGEGFVMQWIALAAFIVGSGLGTYHFGWWKKTFIDTAPKLFLPQLVGWPAAVFGQLLALGALYALCVWWENRRYGDGGD